MEALYGKSGRVHAWLDTSDGNILDLNGQHLAFVDGNSVYDWNGRHIGWWISGCVRDRTNAAAYFTRNAGSIGVLKPLKALKPLKPLKALAPLRPLKELRPLKPLKRMAWSTDLPF
jgi:hypothetical protein